MSSRFLRLADYVVIYFKCNVRLVCEAESVFTVNA
jgi:hypothetical protein